MADRVLVEDVDIAARTSVTDAMTLRAAFKTSWGHPGFTMVRT